MNSRASTLTSKPSKWTTKHEASFRQLVLWINNATADQLEQFKGDEASITYYRDLFTIKNLVP